jgi:hypothetical protein
VPGAGRRRPRSTGGRGGVPVAVGVEATATVGAEVTVAVDLEALMCPAVGRRSSDVWSVLHKYLISNSLVFRKVPGKWQTQFKNNTIIDYIGAKNVHAIWLPRKHAI